MILSLAWMDSFILTTAYEVDTIISPFYSCGNWYRKEQVTYSSEELKMSQ